MRAARKRAARSAAAVARLTALRRDQARSRTCSPRLRCRCCRGGRDARRGAAGVCGCVCVCQTGACCGCVASCRMFAMLRRCAGGPRSHRRRLGARSTAVAGASAASDRRRPPRPEAPPPAGSDAAHDAATGVRSSPARGVRLRAAAGDASAAAHPRQLCPVPSPSRARAANARLRGAEHVSRPRPAAAAAGLGVCGPLRPAGTRGAGEAAVSAQAPFALGAQAAGAAQEVGAAAAEALPRHHPAGLRREQASRARAGSTTALLHRSARAPHLAGGVRLFGLIVAHAGHEMQARLRARAAQRRRDQRPCGWGHLPPRCRHASRNAAERARGASAAAPRAWLLPGGCAFLRARGVAKA